MFESNGSAAVAVDPAALADPADKAQVIRDLQARIRGMQRNRLDTRAIPTHPALADLLPGGALAAGGRYQVAASTTLALALAQGPSAAGAWCAVVGMPDLGVEGHPVVAGGKHAETVGGHGPTLLPCRARPCL